MTINTMTPDGYHSVFRKPEPAIPVEDQCGMPTRSREEIPCPKRKQGSDGCSDHHWSKVNRAEEARVKDERWRHLEAFHYFAKQCGLEGNKDDSCELKTMVVYDKKGHKRWANVIILLDTAHAYRRMRLIVDRELPYSEYDDPVTGRRIHKPLPEDMASAMNEYERMNAMEDSDDGYED